MASSEEKKKALAANDRLCCMLTPIHRDVISGPCPLPPCARATVILYKRIDSSMDSEVYTSNLSGSKLNFCLMFSSHLISVMDRFRFFLEPPVFC